MPFTRINKVLILLVIFSLFVPVTMVAGLNDSFYQMSPGDVSRKEGDYVSFDVNSTQSDELIIEDYTIDTGDGQYQIFSRVQVQTTEQSQGNPNAGMEKQDMVYRYQTGEFMVNIEDKESGKIVVRQLSQMEIQVSLTLGEDVSVGNNMSLEVNEQYSVMLNFGGTTTYQIQGDTEGSTQYEFKLQESGIFTSKLAKKTSEQEQEDKKNKPLPPINVGEEGNIEGPGSHSGLQVAKRFTKKGDVEFTVSGEFNQSRIVQININRELIGENISDMDDIKVEVDGQEIQYMEEWRNMYRTEEPGFYINMTKTETSVYIRMNFSEHTVRIYEEKPTMEVDSPYGVLGLLIGALVVTAGAVILFSKKS